MNPSVVVVGAGNLGLACSARMVARGVPVTMLTGRPDRWSDIAAVDDCNGRHFEGKFVVTDKVTSVCNADLVLLCLPGNAMQQKLAWILPHLRARVPVASVYSGDGFFFIAEEQLGASWPVLGFQRVPFISRTKIPYRLGGITGYKKELFLAHRNVVDPTVWCRFFSSVFDTPTSLLSNFYEAAFVNSNVVLHPARLMSLQRLIDENGPFKRMPMFYGEWDDAASDFAICLDRELREVATRKGACVQPLLEYYESVDAASLTRKIRSILAFKGIASPILPDGKIDRMSRYITSDVLVGLKYVVGFATQFGIKADLAREIVSRYDAV